MSKSFAVRSLVALLWSGGMKSRFLLCLSMGCLLVSRLTALGLPLVYKRIVDAIGLPQGGLSILLWLIMGYGLVRLSSTFFSEVRDLFFAPIEQKAIRKLSRQVFEHLHNLDVQFHLNRKTGELTRVLERGGRAIESFFRYFVFNLLPTFFELSMIVMILLVLYNWYFSVVVLVTLLSYVTFTFKVSAWRLQFMRAINASENALGNRMVDSLLNYATVKQFGNDGLEVNRYDHFLASYEQAALKSRRSLAFLNFGQAVILTAGIVAVMLVALPGVSSGSLTVGDFVLLNTYLLQVYAPLFILGFAYRELKQALVDMEGLFGLLQVTPEIQDVEHPKSFQFQGGEIAFEKVFFAYDPKRPVISNLSFTVSAGKTVAIVGASGSGKSTVVQLLLRFFDPQKGVIKVDGQPIHKMAQKELRDLIGVVPQDTILFNDTLAYNIGYGNPSSSFEAVQDASQRSALDHFIKLLPDGYETVVGERGLKLSGGEKQRVAIARAVLKDPKIFVFDEATSSLDTKTEKEIQKSLFSCAKGHTTLMVAHRLSTVIHADKIVVLEKGSVVEEGTHQELLSKKGVYAQLWQQQKSGKASQSLSVQKKRLLSR